MSNPILGAIQQIAREKKIDETEILKTIEAALAAAYRKDFGTKMQNIQTIFDPKTGALRVFDVKTVVEDELKATWEQEQAERAAAEAVAQETGEPWSPSFIKAAEGKDSMEDDEPRFNPKSMISLTDAKGRKADAVIDEELREELSVPGEFGRMAAQTAKQVIIQRLREAERNSLFEEWEDKAGTLQNGSIQRVEGRMVIVDIANTSGIMPPPEQIPTERYRTGQRLKFYVVAVNKTGKGPEIILSRSHPAMVRALFAVEVPEVENNTVEIKAVAREPGARAKIAVESHEENIDPIGACIGQRGSRVQTVIAELGGEKIDVIKWEENTAMFIQNALAPAKVVRVDIDEATKNASVTVAEDQLSLAIGRSGQNVRLAAKLTGWQINIVSAGKPVVKAAPDVAGEVPVVEATAEPEKKEEVKPEEESKE